MKISTKGEYGIRAMLYIAMHAGHGSVTSHEIARHQGIPEPYLRQILALPCTIDVGTEFCAIREVFLSVKKEVERILSAMTLEELVNRQQEILTQRISVPLDLPIPSLLPVLRD